MAFRFRNLFAHSAERGRQQVDPVLFWRKRLDAVQGNKGSRMLRALLVLVARPSADGDQRLQFVGDAPPVTFHPSSPRTHLSRPHRTQSLVWSFVDRLTNQAIPASASRLAVRS